MATKKAAVAGSVQGPATINPATVAAAQPESARAEVIAQPFPREIIIANDTPMNYTIARTYLAPHSKTPVTVRDQDEITRIQTDCGHLVSLTPAYAGVEVQPLRVIDAAAAE